MSVAIEKYKESYIELSGEKIQLIKDTVCRGSTNEEFQLFIHACQRTGLDPLMRQIHAVKRWDSSLKRESMALQVGIDGYRLIAERTGKYAPGKESLYVYDKEGILISATAFVKKQTMDGTWHEVSATAFFSEYAAFTKEGKPTHMWSSKPHIMLAKCAEACALRKAFPAELSGIYTKEEMEQADNPKIEVIEEIPYDSARDDASIQAFVDTNGLNDFESVREFLVKYSTHYKKPMRDTLTYYTINKDKFLSNYHAWIVKSTKE